MCTARRIRHQASRFSRKNPCRICRLVHTTSGRHGKQWSRSNRANAHLAISSTPKHSPPRHSIVAFHSRWRSEMHIACIAYEEELFCCDDSHTRFLTQCFRANTSRRIGVPRVNSARLCSPNVARSNAIIAQEMTHNVTSVGPNVFTMHGSFVRCDNHRSTRQPATHDGTRRWILDFRYQTVRNKTRA